MVKLKIDNIDWGFIMCQALFLVLNTTYINWFNPQNNSH